MAKNGGRRPGAGRKTNASKMIAAGFAAEYFDQAAQEKLWKSLLSSNDERVRLDAAKYITDRIHGKAAQAVDVAHKGVIEVSVKRVVNDL